MAKPPGSFPLSSTQVKEHQSHDISAVFEHCQATGHNINPRNVKVLPDENSTIKLRVKEASAIKQREPSLNMDEGPDLPPIYNPLLGILLRNLSPHNADDVWVIRTEYSFASWIFALSSVLNDNNNNNNYNSNNNNNDNDNNNNMNKNDDNDQCFHWNA